MLGPRSFHLFTEGWTLCTCVSEWRYGRPMRCDAPIWTSNTTSTMTAEMALHKASLIALVLETFNIGIFTMLFGATLRLGKSNSNRLMLPTLCLIWLLSLTHWIIDIARAVSAFIDTPAGALAYYEDVGNPLEAAKDALASSADDMDWIYRCFIVWDRRWLVVMLPIALWFGIGVTGYGAAHIILLARRGGVFSNGLTPWITSSSSPLQPNVLTTVLIAYRIVRTRMYLHKRNIGNSVVYSALIAFLESAATYSTSLLMLLVSYLLNWNAQYILLDVGITFSMILLRLAIKDLAPAEDSLSSLRFQAWAPNSFPLNGVAVARVVEVDDGTGSFDQGASGKPAALADRDLA
ncbi:hypothetical protein B0H14DRAFT_2866079 [Mycena olivaceomarginata]|nr:hypothetical protein B0H14DRAFT_2866079 [Mycena olivaceomarginata]